MSLLIPISLLSRATEITLPSILPNGLVQLKRRPYRWRGLLPLSRANIRGWKVVKVPFRVYLPRDWLGNNLKTFNARHATLDDRRRVPNLRRLVSDSVRYKCWPRSGDNRGENKASAGESRRIINAPRAKLRTDVSVNNCQ